MTAARWLLWWQPAPKIWRMSSRNEGFHQDDEWTSKQTRQHLQWSAHSTHCTHSASMSNWLPWGRMFGNSIHSFMRTCRRYDTSGWVRNEQHEATDSMYSDSPCTPKTTAAESLYIWNAWHSVGSFVVDSYLFWSDVPQSRQEYRTACCQNSKEDLPPDTQ